MRDEKTTAVEREPIHISSPAQRLSRWERPINTRDILLTGNSAVMIGTARSLSALSLRDRDLKRGIGARGWRGASLVSS